MQTARLPSVDAVFLGKGTKILVTYYFHDKGCASSEDRIPQKEEGYRGAAE